MSAVPRFFCSGSTGYMSENPHGDFIHAKDAAAYLVSHVARLEMDLAETAEALTASQAQCGRLREALDSIRVYGSDTLSGPAQPVDDLRKWYRDGVREMRDRAQAALLSAGGKSHG
jgi:hypothetical protein